MLTPGPGELIHVVRPGENLFRIAQRYCVSVWAIADLNHIADIHYIQAGRCLRIPVPIQPAPERCYIVRSEDTLYLIAQKYGLTVEQIAEANGIDPPYDIRVGQCLIIPGVGWPVTPGLTLTPTIPWYVTGTPMPSPTTPWYVTGTPAPSPTIPWYVTATPTPSPTIPWYVTGTPTLFSNLTDVPEGVSSRGNFYIKYPTGWQMTPYDQPEHFGFWAQESSDPFSPLVGVISRPGVGRGSYQVLAYYKEALPGLLNGRLSQPTLTWNNNPGPIPERDDLLAVEDYAWAWSGGREARIRLIAFPSFRAQREYMILFSAPIGSWPDKLSLFESVVKSFGLRL